jgi:hypothetical protein
MNGSSPIFLWRTDATRGKIGEHIVYYSEGEPISSPVLEKMERVPPA